MSTIHIHRTTTSTPASENRVCQIGAPLGLHPRATSAAGRHPGNSAEIMSASIEYPTSRSHDCNALDAMDANEFGPCLKG